MPATPRFEVSAEQLGFTPVGATSPGFAPESILHGQLTLAGLACHVEAFQVEERDGETVLVNPTFQDGLDALTLLNGNRLQTATIDGRTYTVVVYPHQR